MNGGVISISANRINIAGTTVFTAGWAAVVNAEADIDVLNTTNAPAEASADVTATNTAADATDYTGNTISGVSVQSAGAGARVLIFPDANTGIQVIDDGGNDVFVALVGGADVGDVIVGDYANDKGMKWDKSAGSFTVLGLMQTAASGKRMVMDNSDNTMRFYSSIAGNPNVMTFDDGIVGSIPGILISSVNGGIIRIEDSDSGFDFAAINAYSTNIRLHISSAHDEAVIYAQNVETTTSDTKGVICAAIAAGKTGALFTGIHSTVVFKVDHLGNITVAGTVDGRDIATDGSKLDNIETNADVTDTTNVTAAMTDGAHGTRSGGTLHADVIAAGADGFMTGADKTKLNSVASGAQPGTVTAVTGSAPVASSGGTTPAISMLSATAARNGYMTLTYAGKLDGIESLADVTDAINVGAIMSDGVHGNRGGGALHADVVAAVSDGFMNKGDKTKLNGIANNADVTGANAPQAHTHPTTAITDFPAYGMPQIGLYLRVSGSGMSLYWSA